MRGHVMGQRTGMRFAVTSAKCGWRRESSEGYYSCEHGAKTGLWAVVDFKGKNGIFCESQQAHSVLYTYIYRNGCSVCSTSIQCFKVINIHSVWGCWFPSPAGLEKKKKKKKGLRTGWLLCLICQPTCLTEKTRYRWKRLLRASPKPNGRSADLNLVLTKSSHTMRIRASASECYLLISAQHLIQSCPWKKWFLCGLQGHRLTFHSATLVSNCSLMNHWTFAAALSWRHQLHLASLRSFLCPFSD